jgi:hypothetical protein
MESLVFLTEKTDGTIKAQTCANSSTQKEYTNHNKAVNLAAIIESHLVTVVTNAKQGRDVIIADIPNAFVQTNINKKPNSNKTIMTKRDHLSIALYEFLDFV